MEILLAFAIGWAVGAKGGDQGFSDVIEAARTLRRSAEFQGLVDALKQHFVATLRGLADAIGEGDEGGGVDGVMERVIKLMARGDEPA